MRRLLTLIAWLPLLALPVTTSALAVEIEEVTSPGGVTAWLVRDDISDIVAMSFSFRAGSSHDPEGRKGLAEMTASLLTEGAGELDSRAFRQQLEDQSISLRFSAGPDSVQGSLRTLNRYRDEAVELLRSALTEPRFDADAVERVRGQILVSLNRSRAEPRSQARRVLFHTLFDGHPYAFEPAGVPEDVRAVAVDDMRSFVRNHLTRDRLLIGVVGAIAPDELGPMLDRIFGDLPATGAARNVPEPETMPVGETVVVEHDAPQSVAIFAQPGIDRRDPDYYPAFVLTHILGGGGFQSRLMQEIREKRGLAYSTYAYMHGLDAKPLIVGGVSTRNDAIGESLAVIREQWADVRERGVTAEELERAKTFLTGSYPLRFTTTGAIANALVGIQYHDLGIDYIDRRNTLVDAVSLEDVNRVARQLLDPDGLTVVIMGQPEGIEPSRAAPDLGG